MVAVVSCAFQAQVLKVAGDVNATLALTLLLALIVSVKTSMNARFQEYAHRYVKT